jgi:hypothetical protein
LEKRSGLNLRSDDKLSVVGPLIVGIALLELALGYEVGSSPLSSARDFALNEMPRLFRSLKG